MAHWLWLSSTAWLKVPSSSRLREDPIERGKLRSVNLLHRTRARPDSIHVRADRCRDHPEEFISQPHRWPYFFHHNGPVSRRHRQLKEDPSELRETQVVTHAGRTTGGASVGREQPRGQTFPGAGRSGCEWRRAVAVDKAGELARVGADQRGLLLAA